MAMANIGRIIDTSGIKTPLKESLINTKRVPQTKRVEIIAPKLKIVILKTLWVIGTK